MLQKSGFNHVICLMNLGLGVFSIFSFYVVLYILGSKFFFGLLVLFTLSVYFCVGCLMLYLWCWYVFLVKEVGV